MKRYRVLSFDFDSRVHSLTMAIRDEWEENVKRQHRQNRESVEKSLIDSTERKPARRNARTSSIWKASRYLFLLFTIASTNRYGRPL
jgi:hypothetical protein